MPSNPAPRTVERSEIRAKGESVSSKSWINWRALGVSLIVVAGLSSWIVAGGMARPADIWGASDTGAQASASGAQATLVAQLALARSSTAKYVTDLQQAKADGYQIITRMIPNMGYHFMNPAVKGFNLKKPAILVYQHRGSSWQLGALEWVYTAKPARPPLPGARYGTFGAGCHFVDGTFVPADTQEACPKASPQTGAKFNFWHPQLVTLHVWLWYPNPSGLYAGTNPLAAAYNQG
jgi:hypothetical protein